MKSADQRGCMLAVRTCIPMNPSRTDHIMSRYRPIAPKPTPKSEGIDQTDSHSPGSLSVDKSSKLTEYSRGKRRSKRADASTKSSPRNAKKLRHGTSSGSAKSGAGTGTGTGSGAGAGAEGNVEFQPPSFNLTPIFSEQVAPVFGPGGLQRFKDSFDHSQAGVSVSLSLSAKSPPRDHALGGIPMDLHSTLQCSKDGLSFNIGSAAAAAPAGAPNPQHPERDLGFMERAAINSTSFFSTDYSNLRTRAPFFGGYTSFSTSFGADSEVCSAEEAAPESKNIVTLSLLPDTPSFVRTRSTSSTSTLSLLRSDIRWSPDTQPAMTSSDLNTSLTMSSIGRASSQLDHTSLGRFSPRATDASHGDAAMVVVDAHSLEQRHGGSSEAVMLTDDRDAVLWVNSAFQRLSNERMSSRMQAIGPHIDPLGIRTRLASLTFQPPFPAAKCKAVLWGFLKKFIMHEGSHISSGCHAQAPQQQQQQQQQPKVIAPQPLRAVGSTITVQTVDTLNPNAAPLCEGYDSVQERLNKGDMPAVITDLRFRVRWVNTAYKRLVGQPKCSWLATTVGDGQGHGHGHGHGHGEAAPLRLAGDVAVVCDGMQLPNAMAAFTCRVGIQWSHQGEHSAMSVPSQVARLDDDGSGTSSYVWRFDVCDAGVKNVLQIESAASPFC